MRGMEYWEISVEAILAWVLWLTGTGVVVVDLVAAADLGAVGLLVCGGGAVLTIRRSHLNVFDMQRKAFQLGRDFEHGQIHADDNVHAIR